MTVKNPVVSTLSLSEVRPSDPKTRHVSGLGVILAWPILRLHANPTCFKTKVA